VKRHHRSNDDAHHKMCAATTTTTTTSNTKRSNGAGESPWDFNKTNTQKLVRVLPDQIMSIRYQAGSALRSVVSSSVIVRRAS
jgi:hypothetical protein